MGASKTAEKFSVDALTEAEIFADYERAIGTEIGRIFDDLHDGLHQYIEFTRGKGSLQEWIETNRRIAGKPFSYSSATATMLLGDRDTKLETAPRPYLTQYINDTTPDKTVIKCRQSEFTESEVNENIWLAAVRPFTNISHIFPTMGMANKMAREKISPAMMMSPRIADLIKKPYNITSASFANGSFYTTDSSWTDYQGRGPSRDKITFDEYESQNPQIEEIYGESTSHSELARKTRISTPRFPNTGIDGRYLKGCQYEWHVTCVRCHKEQKLEFPENIINFFDAKNAELNDDGYMERLKKVYIGCRFCGCYIDRASPFYVETSRWVANKPNLGPLRASYRVTYMMLPWKTGAELTYKYHSFRFLHQFWNEIMGFAFVSPESEIHRDLFEACADNGTLNQYQRMGMARNVSIGVDWGDPSWVVVRANGFPPNPSQPRVIYVEKIDRESLIAHGLQPIATEHVKRVDAIMSFFQGKILINDANGLGVDRNAYLIRRYPTRAWGCFYDTDENSKQRRKEKLLTPQWGENNRRVTVSRLATMKMLVQEYEERRVSIPRQDPVVNTFIDHHANLVFETYEDEKTGSPYEVVGSKGPDHFAHADNYARIGFDRLQPSYGRKGMVPGVIDERQAAEQQLLDNMHPLLNQ
jgi:hypothetical protein